MMDGFHGVDSKLRWAKTHLDILNHEIGDFVKPKVRRISEQTYAAPGQPLGDPIYKIIDPPAIPADWSLLIGDFGYNLRAALDHLARQLAIIDNPTIPPTKLFTTEFPIFDSEWGYVDQFCRDRKGYRSKGSGGLHKIRQLSQAHQAAITNLQPYHGRVEDRPLLLLHQLRNLDAHQELHVTAFRITMPHKPVAVAIDLGNGEFDVGFRGDSGKKTRVKVVGGTLSVSTHVEGTFPAKIIFDEPVTLLNEQEVLPLLNSMWTRVNEVVNEFR